jgi:hypothetical protein
MHNSDNVIANLRYCPQRAQDVADARTRHTQRQTEPEEQIGTLNGRSTMSMVSGAPGGQQTMSRLTTSATALKRHLTMAQMGQGGKMTFQRTPGGRLDTVGNKLW